MLAKIYHINLIQIIVSYGSKEGLVIFCLDYALVFVEGDNITTITTYKRSSMEAREEIPILPTPEIFP